MVKFDFTKRDIVMMAAFLALMMVAEAIWILGSVFAPFGIGIYYGAVLIIAAIVISKRYTILTRGIAKTIIMLLIPDTYGGIWRPYVISLEQSSWNLPYISQNHMPKT